MNTRTIRSTLVMLGLAVSSSPTALPSKDSKAAALWARQMTTSGTVASRTIGMPQHLKLRPKREDRKPEGRHVAFTLTTLLRGT
jgi:hypothetical protein